MYIIIWEYLVRPEHVAEFEEIYSPNGAWARLFQKSKGFLKLELVRDEKHSRRYVTIDQWASIPDYELFMAAWKNEYTALDTQCENLTEQETLLIKGELASHKTQ